MCSSWSLGFVWYIPHVRLFRGHIIGMGVSVRFRAIVRLLKVLEVVEEPATFGPPFWFVSDVFLCIFRLKVSLSLPLLMPIFLHPSLGAPRM